MSESTRRRRYRYDRVVIESARILDSQFADGVLCFTGAQIELMRNMTEYLRRLETYCSEYHLGYYLTPTVEDYDSLMAIVANLEGTLMGNLNTIFGYKASQRIGGSHTKSGDGDKTIYIGNVPAGEIWRIELFYAVNKDSVCSRIELVNSGGFGGWPILVKDSPAADERVTHSELLTFTEGMSIQGTFYDCLDGDRLEWRGFGYSMAVPEE